MVAGTTLHAERPSSRWQPPAQDAPRRFGYARWGRRSLRTEREIIAQEANRRGLTFEMVTADRVPDHHLRKYRYKMAILRQKARRWAMWRMRTELGYSYHEIARAVGVKSHDTVIYAIGLVENEREGRGADKKRRGRPAREWRDLLRRKAARLSRSLQLHLSYGDSEVGAVRDHGAGA